MEQAPQAQELVPVRDVGPDEVWGEVKVEAEWAGRSPQAPVEIVYAPSAGTRSLILLDSPAINRPALSVER